MQFRHVLFILFVSLFFTPTSGTAMEQNTNEGFYEVINRFGPPARKAEHEANREDVWYYQDKILTFREGILIKNISTVESPFLKRRGRREIVTAALPAGSLPATSKQMRDSPKIRVRNPEQQTSLRAILEEIEKTVPSDPSSPSDRRAVPSPQMDARSGRAFQLAE